MLKRRLLFTKTGRAIFLSHLDLMRTFQRAFLRADIRLRHTEGFNPHPVMSFALPLSVGTQSVCELLDFQLDGDAEPAGFLDRLGRALPEGIGVLRVYEPERKFSELKWLEVRGRLDYDGGVPDGAADALRELFDSQKLILTKKTKKGAADFDIIPCIKRVAFEKTGETEMAVNAVISAQDPSLNPKYLVEAVGAQGSGGAARPDFAAFTRVEVFDREGRIYR
jgi:radical SAM-linked protein